MSLTDRFVDELSSDVTQNIQKGVFDLKVVGSDLGNAIENIVQKYEEGAISFGTVVDYLGLKLSQIEEDIALRDTAEFGALDIGTEFERFQKMRGAAISSSSLEEDLDLVNTPLLDLDDSEIRPSKESLDALNAELLS